jgi:hypothetical protein
VALLGSYTRVLFQHATLARAAQVARPYGPNYLAVVEAVLALLHEGGVPDAQAAWAVDVLLLAATATAVEHSVRSEDEAAEMEFDATVTAMRNADTTTHPRIAAVGEELFSGAAGQRLDWTLRVLINGASVTPRGFVSAVSACDG